MATSLTLSKEELRDLTGYEQPSKQLAELRRLHALNAGLLEAGKSVISWTEAAHRPPVRDDMEFGRMVSVRLHALADLYAAISKAEGREA